MPNCIVVVQFDLPKRSEEMAVKGGTSTAPTYRGRPASVVPPGPHPRDLISERAYARMRSDRRRFRTRLALFVAVGFLAAGGVAAELASA